MTTKEEHIAITKYDLYYESRMTKVESAIEHMAEDIKEIKTEYRWLFRLMIGGFGSIVTLIGAMFVVMAHGFEWF